MAPRPPVEHRDRRLVPALGSDQVAAYLERLGLDLADLGQPDRGALDRLCLAHLRRVAFENMDQVFGDGVPHRVDAAVAKIVGGRGGWCFELNGAFGRLLAALGYDVLFIGCAVLLGGPSRRIDHLALEVTCDDATSPLLVDVGFGDSFVFPLELNRAGPQPGGNGDYELIGSPEGTTLTHHVDGVPEARYRFKRVALDFEAFAPEARRLQTDPTLHWSTTPVVSRLVEPTERITLRADRLDVTVDGNTRTEAIGDRSRWDEALADHFGMQRPGPWPTGT